MLYNVFVCYKVIDKHLLTTMSTMLTRYAMDVEELDREQAQTEI